jgi:DNA-binding transcriptional ArsR family regulator
VAEVSVRVPRRDPLAGAVELFKAVASPVRLAVVVELAVGPRCVHELSDALRAGGRTVSQPLLSQHLRVLRDVGLVTTARRSTEVTYRLADEHVAHIVSDAIRHAQEEHPEEEHP